MCKKEFGEREAVYKNSKELRYLDIVPSTWPEI
jgi:hypothetical protein